MVWYGMVWYGMVWYGMVWYGMVWYGMVWYGMVWYGMVWYVWYCACFDLRKGHNVTECQVNKSCVFLCPGVGLRRWREVMERHFHNNTIILDNAP